MSAALAVGAALARLLVADAAAAGDPATAFRIDYTAPSSCPDREALYAHVTARTQRARVAGPEESARELVVDVAEDGGRFRGRLIVPASGEVTKQEREVTDASCEDLIEALGFFVALSIDPEASAAPAPTAAPASGPPPRIAPPAPASSPARPSPASSARGGRSSTASPVAHAPSWRVGGGAGAVIASGVAPHAVVGSRLFVDVSRAPGGSLLAPLVALTAVSTVSGVETTRLGGLALRWQGLGGAACPVALAGPTSLTLRLCSTAEVGRLIGGGVGIRNARRVDALFVALGIAWRVEVAMSSMLVLGLDLGVSSPLVRPRFSYSSGAVAFESAALGARAGLTLAFRL